MSAFLEVRGLTLELATPQGPVLAVEGVDLTLHSKETLALVGESGSGKTLTALAVMGLLPRAVRVVAGQIVFRGRDLLRLHPAERRALCGKEIAMSFQEPASALNPVLTIGAQVAESWVHRAGMSRAAARARAIELLGEVGLPDAAEQARRYPHELSGGERQRVMLAGALALGPSLLLADEPTSALDAPVQAEILALLARLSAQREMAVLLITHDLAVVSELATRVAVMYAGRIVEEADVLALFEAPSHPYTVGLLRSRASALRRGGRFPAIPGQVPPVGVWPAGCRFHPRCALADERCGHEGPTMLPARSGVPETSDVASPASPPPMRPPDPTLTLRDHRVACHHPGEAGSP